jgi:hypothetical protein
MVWEWAADGRLTSEQIDEIEAALEPPPSWRDPLTGLPAGFGDEDDEWGAWERAAHG